MAASTIVFTHDWDQLVLNHANSKNIVFQRLYRFFDTPCIIRKTCFMEIILGLGKHSLTLLLLRE